MLKFTAGRVVAAAATAFGLVIAAQGTAAAAPKAIEATFGGYGEWNPDPYDGIPGDSIRACDTTADGWGIEVKIDIGRNGTWDRIANTRGHNSPYCSPWKSGNIKEGTPVSIQVANVNGGVTYPKGSLLLSHA
ncbi:hypothetical protein P8A22_34320 [Streptomyces laculatispora]|uniref:Secreted protein n=1 Tax=Streptomyces laculatispora TaxID=887464 RepID=A0ABY9ICB5_9ACTN|nr:hypothetical protein [Streptomyces laculatispora]WLQ44538.1 hypothetical protein P8A22_34320 [Streptomyces laculatispora]